MTAAEHYTRAQMRLDIAEILDTDGDPQAAALQVATAQVHATLALAGVTGLRAAVGQLWEGDAQEWERLASAENAWRYHQIHHDATQRGTDCRFCPSSTNGGA